MGNLSERIAALSPEKIALLERRLKRKGKAVQDPTISHEKSTEKLPLSFAQERLWFLEQFQPGSPVYNVPAVMRLAGAVNVHALEWSFNEIVRRHEVLRTTFVSQDGEPVQVVAPELKLELPVSDLAHLSGLEQEREMQRLATTEAQEVFDLSRGPLLRIRVLRLAAQDQLLLMTLHHIIADGWSLGILFGELATLYEAACQGKPSPLPPLPIQYSDFAQWQRRWLSGERLQAEVQYWRQRLAGVPATLGLATDRPRPAVQTYAGHTHLFNCSQSVTEKLTQISAEIGGTLFMVLLAAFKVLLYRYTGQADLVVGTPIANRNRTELEDLIGFFVNTLALRTDLSGDPTFFEAAQRVKDTTLGAYEHQDVPFEKLVEELQPVRSLGHSPLFQVLFALQNTPPLGSETLKNASSLRHASEVGTDTAKFDMSVFFYELSGELNGGIEYNTDLFEQSTIERMAQHLKLLLAEVAENPEKRLSELALLTRTERQQILEWNNTETLLPAVSDIQQLFEAQVEQTPNAIAIAFAETTLTYRDLNRRANKLAHFLRSRNVAPDVCVGCCIEPSFDMMISVLAILKAGGVYVPLDPGLPERRLAFMVDDAAMPVVLAQKKFAATFASSNVEVVLIDEALEAPEAPSSEANPASRIDPDNLSYIIYTSGSTGTPKGVAMTHRALLNLIAWQVANAAHAPKTVQFVSPGFDVSVQEMFATWCAGGTLLLTREETRRDPNELLKFLSDNAIDRMFLAPVALRHLAGAAVSTKNLRLKEVFVAGEQLQITEPIATLFSKLNHCVLYNQYGPSETHVASQFIVSRPRAGHAPPIGGPIANTHIFILDSTAPVMLPVGVPGELCIGGACLARGYLNRPDLTAEKFIPDPFSKEPGARLYRTGDLARYRPDGNVEFLGRIDQQVKIRGFRIECGEVEAVLSQHPAVKEAVVVARESESGEKNLVAYLVAGNVEPPTVSELHRFLLGTLPQYMVPSTFTFIEAVPLTATGKVDRDRLPAVAEHVRPDLDREFVEPRSSVEEKLVDIWRDVLKLDRIGVYDNFFELGGHSLLVTQVISRVRDAFKQEIPLKNLFESPSVAQFAELIDETRPAALLDEPIDTSELVDAPLVQRPAPRIEPVIAVTPTFENGNEVEILARLDTLSDQDVTRLLTELLAGNERVEQPAPVFATATAPPPVQVEVKPVAAAVTPPPAQTPEQAWANYHRHMIDAHLRHWHDQRLIWLESQRRLAEAHLLFLQELHQVEMQMRQGLASLPVAVSPPAPIFHHRPFNPPTPQLPKPAQPPVAPSEPPRKPETVKTAPVSFAQQRLWFLTQLQPDGFAYNVPTMMRMPGTVDVSALEWSFNEIVRRHEVLRTTFMDQDGEPVQVIAPELTIELPVSDLSHLSGAEQEQEMQRIATAEAQHVFDLSRGPLLRIRLLRLAEQDHLLLISLHHIVADGWSLGILFRELATLYEAAAQGLPSPLAPLSIQYADFAQWQRRWLSGERLRAEVEYWRQRLAGAPAELGLATDRPRPVVQSYAGATHLFYSPRTITKKLAQISAEIGGTLFMVLLAAFKVLLYRYTGQPDLVVGTPIANRNRTELEGLIGFFVNQIALRTDLSGDPTFLEAAQRVKDTTLGAYEHQDLPFEKLIEELQPRRTLAHAPMFQIIFGIQNNPTLVQTTAPAGTVQDTGLAMPQVHSATAKMDLTWQLAQTPDGLAGIVEYSTDLFDEATVAQMANRFLSLLEQVTEDPEKHLSEFQVLGDSETGGRTLQDFPDVEMTQQDFENLLLELQQS